VLNKIIGTLNWMQLKETRSVRYAEEAATEICHLIHSKQNRILTKITKREPSMGYEIGATRITIIPPLLLHHQQGEEIEATVPAEKRITVPIPLQTSLLIQKPRLGLLRHFSLPPKPLKLLVIYPLFLLMLLSRQYNPLPQIIFKNPTAGLGIVEQQKQIAGVTSIQVLN